MFMLFEFMFPIIFVMVFGMIIFQFVTGIGTWHKNNQSPRLSVSATIVAKRENITHHSHANAGDLSGTHGYHSTSSTSYYVTFQVDYILNTNTKKFHRPSCSSVKQMKESNKKSSSESRDALIAAGYDPCKKCNP